MISEKKRLKIDSKTSSQVDPVTQAKLQALLETTGIGKISGESKPLADPEVSSSSSWPTSNFLNGMTTMGTQSLGLARPQKSKDTWNKLETCVKW